MIFNFYVAFDFCDSAVFLSRKMQNLGGVAMVSSLICSPLCASRTTRHQKHVSSPTCCPTWWLRQVPQVELKETSCIIYTACVLFIFLFSNEPWFFWYYVTALTILYSTYSTFLLWNYFFYTNYLSFFIFYLNFFYPLNFNMLLIYTLNHISN